MKIGLFIWVPKVAPTTEEHGWKHTREGKARTQFKLDDLSTGNLSESPANSANKNPNPFPLDLLHLRTFAPEMFPRTHVFLSMQYCAKINFCRKVNKKVLIINDFLKHWQADFNAKLDRCFGVIRAPWNQILTLFTLPWERWHDDAETSTFKVKRK